MGCPACCAPRRDDVEEVANSAVKEEQIETRLASIESDWAAFNLVGATRGRAAARRALCPALANTLGPACGASFRRVLCWLTRAACCLFPRLPAPCPSAVLC